MQANQDTDEGWRLSVDDFTPRTDTAGLSKHVASFYLQQNELIQSYRQLDLLHDSDARKSVSD